MSKEILDNLNKKVEILLQASALSLINVDNPNEGEKIKKANMDLMVCMHLEAQTCLLKEMLDMLDNINEKLAQANINIQDVEQEVSKLNPMFE